MVDLLKLCLIFVGLGLSPVIYIIIEREGFGYTNIHKHPDTHTHRHTCISTLSINISCENIPASTHDTKKAGLKLPFQSLCKLLKPQFLATHLAGQSCARGDCLTALLHSWGMKNTPFF